MNPVEKAKYVRELYTKIDKDIKAKNNSLGIYHSTIDPEPTNTVANHGCWLANEFQTKIDNYCNPPQRRDYDGIKQLVKVLEFKYTDSLYQYLAPYWHNPWAHDLFTVSYAAFKPFEPWFESFEEEEIPNPSFTDVKNCMIMAFDKAAAAYEFGPDKVKTKQFNRMKELEQKLKIKFRKAVNHENRPYSYNKADLDNCSSTEAKEVKCLRRLYYFEVFQLCKYAPKGFLKEEK